MALTKHKGIAIKAIVNVLPKNKVDNLTLDLIEESVRQKLVDHTGIRYRRKSVLKVEQLFEKGIKETLAITGWNTSDVDVLICVTQTPELSIPSVSCKLHGILNLNQQTLCYDINSGCSGYVYGLQTVASILSTINKKNPKALLCCGDVSTLLLASDDQATQPIFSDAVSVTAITYDDNNTNVTARFNLETIGSGQKAIHTEIDEHQNKIMRLNGIDVFAYSVKFVPQNIEVLLQSSNTATEKPSFYVFHQANKIINDAIAKKLQLNESQVPQTLYQYGNTASASIPITLCTCLNQINNHWVLLSGFGVGFSVASGLIKLSDIISHKTIEI